MKSSVIAGIVLGVLVAIWTLLMGATGLYKHPIGALLFFVVIPINIAVVVWGLRKTRDRGFRYRQQLLAGLVIGVVGGAIVFCNSYLFTTVLFPNYFDDLLAIQEEMLGAAGLPEEQIAARMEAAEAAATPRNAAVQGAIGTVVTSLVTTMIAGAFLRKKD
jgi:hypothetical protein